MPESSTSESTWLFSHGEMEDGEHFLRISPDPRGVAKSGGRSQPRESVERLFVRELGDDLFAVTESELAAAYAHCLVTLAQQVHFDPAFALVVNGAMSPACEVEIRAQLLVRA